MNFGTVLYRAHFDDQREVTITQYVVVREKPLTLCINAPGVWRQLESDADPAKKASWFPCLHPTDFEGCEDVDEFQPTVEAALRNLCDRTQAMLKNVMGKIGQLEIEKGL